MKNTANNNTVRFTIDFINKKIIGTKASFDNASNYGYVRKAARRLNITHQTFIRWTDTKNYKKYT